MFATAHKSVTTMSSRQRIKSLQITEFFLETLIFYHFNSHLAAIAPRLAKMKVGR